MQSRITGTTMPVLEFVLEPNETVISEAGELSWMGASIQMTTHTQLRRWRRPVWRLEARGRGRIDVHDRIPRHRRARRVGIRR